jgi:pimeloyl-ACP methyl ester carboxylesterase
VSFEGGLHYDRYMTAGSAEWLMRIGEATAPPILFIPPLLEEMNRTRAFMASMMRSAAARGYGCWLLDLPGTGESERALDACSWSDWEEAVADAAATVRDRSGGSVVVASVRGGALLDGAAASPGWRFAPAEGASLARDLVRASLLKAEELNGPRVQLAGYALSDRLFGELGAATLNAAAVPLRTVRLASDRAEAELKLEGPALWRRSEPANAPELAAALAADLASWAEQCAVC